MKKILLSTLILIFSCSQSWALSMSGSVSADYDLSFESIIKRKFGEILEFSKIFEKNDDIYYQRRYKPVYMLSRADLYSVAPIIKSNLEKRKIPNTYNLTFEANNSNSLNNLSFSAENLENDVAKLISIEQTLPFEEVKKEYQVLIQKNPNRIELLYKYAQFLYQHKNYKEAIAVLNEIRDKDDGFVLASYTLGNIYFDLGEYKKAIKSNIEVIKKNPYCADAYFNIASALEKLHKFNLAIDYYQKCLSLNANDEQAQNALQRLEQLSLVVD